MPTWEHNKKKPKSIKNKWKDKSFATVDYRNIIENSPKMLESDLSELITETIETMKTVAGYIEFKRSI